MRFNVPLIPDPRWVDHLTGRQDHLAAVHFSLYSPGLADARVRMEHQALDHLAAALERLDLPRKYALINARFQSPEGVLTPEALDRMLEPIRRLADRGLIDGLVYADQYLLTALSDADPTLAKCLEAVPSVNFMIDGPLKAAAVLEAASGSHFHPPAKLALDRSLNRRPDRLAETSSWLRRHYPGMEVELLANEGCLFECPFKLTHDAHIALANATPAANRTGELNRLFGCRRVVERDPWLVFKSPFIRPEDVDRYQYTADAIKICGRTLGPDFLIRAFDAYLDRRFEGNLLELFDSLDYLAERLEIPNTRLPADFYDRTAHCDKMCRACGWCRDLLDRTGRFVEPRLADFRPGGR